MKCEETNNIFTHYCLFIIFFIIIFLEATAEAAAADGETNNTTNASDAPPQKRGLLNAIKLPIANMIPRKKTDDDVELGMGKAGLASMETLDDSLKDQDCVDKAPARNNGTEDPAKLKKATSSEIKQESPEDVSITEFKTLYLL